MEASKVLMSVLFAWLVLAWLFFRFSGVVCFVLFCVLHRVSLNRPRTQDADQADLEFRDLTVSTSRVLGLRRVPPGDSFL